MSTSLVIGRELVREIEIPWSDEADLTHWLWQESRAAGYPVAREVKLPRGRVDLVLWERGCSARSISAGTTPDMLVEVKVALSSRASVLNAARQIRGYATTVKAVTGAEPHLAICCVSAIRGARALLTRQHEQDRLVQLCTPFELLNLFGAAA